MELKLSNSTYSNLIQWINFFNYLKIKLNYNLKIIYDNIRHFLLQITNENNFIEKRKKVEFCIFVKFQKKITNSNSILI